MRVPRLIYWWGSISLGLSGGWVSGAEVTFAEHVAPLIYQNCIECHNRNGIGPFSLLTYDDVKRRARQIAEVTDSGFMPPWKPSAGYGPPLVGERRLTQDQRDLLKNWYLNGSPMGDMEILDEPPEVSNNWALGEPDLVVTIPGEYMLPAEGKDIYFNFVLPIPIDEGRYVRSIEFLPESRLVIHHAVMSFDQTAWSRNKAASEIGFGFAGMELGNASDPAGQFIGWTPGQVPFQPHPGTAWTLDPGTDMVLQLHMLPNGKATKIQPKIGLHFTDLAPTRETMTVKLVDQKIDIPPGESEYIVEQSMVLPVGVEVLSLYPHTHYLAKEIEVFGILPSGEQKWLLRIADWDFNWQSDYRYKEPLPLPSGTQLVMRYSYDNSDNNIRNPYATPKRITFGPNSTDEMAEVAITLLLEKSEDLPVLEKAYQDYRVQAAGKVRFFYDQGMSFLKMGLWDEAFNSLQVCIVEDSNFAPAFSALGFVYSEWGDRETAAEFHAKALNLEPDNVAYQLAYVRAKYPEGGVQAQLLLKDYLLKNPESESIRLELADVYLRGNRVISAIGILEEGLSLGDNEGSISLRLGRIYGQIGEIGKATERLAAAAATQGDTPETRQIQADALFAQALLVQSKDTSRASASLKRAIERVPDHKGALLYLAQMSLQADEPASVLYLSKLVELPEGRRLPNRAFIGDLPFPNGVLMLIDLYRDRGLEQLADALLEESIAHARNRDRRDWVLKLEAKLKQ